MKITEMSLEQLQDYAITQQEEINAYKEREKGYTGQIEELNEVNKALQKRNNDLFMKVAQTVYPDEKTPAPVEKTETCEEFVKRYLGGN